MHTRQKQGLLGQLAALVSRLSQLLAARGIGSLVGQDDGDQAYRQSLAPVRGVCRQAAQPSRRIRPERRGRAG